jgi:hypothetical protein
LSSGNNNNNNTNTNSDAAASLLVSIYKLLDPNLGYYIPEAGGGATEGSNTTDNDDAWKYVEHVAVYDMVNRAFVGKSPSIAMMRSSGGVGSDFDGNTILLHLDALRYYVFIGSGISNVHVCCAAQDARYPNAPKKNCKSIIYPPNRRKSRDTTLC